MHTFYAIEERIVNVHPELATVEEKKPPEIVGILHTNGPKAHMKFLPGFTLDKGVCN
jgi:hypothetical protein